MAEELSGVLCVNKHAGLSSHDIVNRIRRLYGTKKAGHTGTLDPMATGVLPVMIGRAAKAAEYLGADNKEYVAQLQLGISTDTEDVTGNVISRCDILPAKEQFVSVLEQFKGIIYQVPPMYSAIKINGRKLVDMARKGIEVDRPPRRIEIFDIELLDSDEKSGIYKIRVCCSKGTYIRTLCKDIGEKLGCGAAMSSLCRTKSGCFKIEESYSIAQLEEMSESEKAKLLLPCESLFRELNRIELQDFFSHLARCGCEIYLKKIGLDFPLGERLSLYDRDGFFAVGEVMEFEEGKAVKPIKQFRL